MSLIAKRNILLEALKIPRPIFFSVFHAFLPNFLTNRASLRHYIHPSSFFDGSVGHVVGYGGNSISPRS